jgi:small-conductance mechanosensitive channel
VLRDVEGLSYYVRGILEVGQTITVEGQQGRIRAIETTTTVLDTEDGVSLHVPNHVLLETIVKRHDPVGEAAGQDA